MRVKLEREVNKDTLRKMTKEETNSRILIRLIFISLIEEGVGVPQASRIVGITKATGYQWLRRWNKGGYEGIKPCKQPGRPSKLKDQEREKLREILQKKRYWTTKEVKSVIKEQFRVEYSSDQTIRILKSFGMHCAKPYPKDFRRPANAEEILKRKIETELSRRGGKIVIGFIDEFSAQTHDNRVRVWSFRKPEIRKNTDRKRVNTIGFYSIKGGRSVVSFKENSKKENFIEFLEDIKAVNSNTSILAILDNFPTHKSTEVRKKAEELDIRLVYLPPYSPDLNPIEFIWKSIKRELSLLFVKAIEDIKKKVKESFEFLSKKVSFAKGGIRKFLPANVSLSEPDEIPELEYLCV